MQPHSRAAPMLPSLGVSIETGVSCLVLGESGGRDPASPCAARVHHEIGWAGGLRCTSLSCVGVGKKDLSVGGRLPPAAARDGAARNPLGIFHRRESDTRPSTYRNPFLDLPPQACQDDAIARLKAAGCSSRPWRPSRGILRPKTLPACRSGASRSRSHPSPTTSWLRTSWSTRMQSRGVIAALGTSAPTASSCATTGAARSAAR